MINVILLSNLLVKFVKTGIVERFLNEIKKVSIQTSEDMAIKDYTKSVTRPRTRVWKHVDM